MAKVKGKAIDNTTKDMTNWDAELAAAAQAAANVAAEQAGGGAKRISIRSGQMTIDDNPVPGNALVAVITAFTMHNKYFGGQDYDPENPTSPVCYAYGDTKDEMGPHDSSEDKQASKCEGCAQNEFGSAEKGKGKACKNTFQLLLLPVGSYDHKQDSYDQPEKTDEIEDAEGYTLSVPPTSLKAWSGYVAKLAGNLRPPWAVFTKVSVTPDPKTQWKLGFELVDNAPSTFLQTLKARHEQGMKELIVEYPKNSEREERPAKKPGKKRY